MRAICFDYRRTCFRNLPFVGFTFTSTKGKVAAGLGKADTQGLEAQLKAKAAELAGHQSPVSPRPVRPKQRYSKKLKANFPS